MPADIIALALASLGLGAAQGFAEGKVEQAEKQSALEGTTAKDLFIQAIATGGAAFKIPEFQKFIGRKLGKEALAFGEQFSQTEEGQLAAKMFRAKVGEQVAEEQIKTQQADILGLVSSRAKQRLSAVQPGAAAPAPAPAATPSPQIGKAVQPDLTPMTVPAPAAPPAKGETGPTEGTRLLFDELTDTIGELNDITRAREGLVPGDAASEGRIRELDTRERMARKRQDVLNEQLDIRGSMEPLPPVEPTPAAPVPSNAEAQPVRPPAQAMSVAQVTNVDPAAYNQDLADDLRSLGVSTFTAGGVSIKATTDEEFGRKFIAARSRKVPLAQAAFEAADNGLPVPPETRERAFNDAFFRNRREIEVAAIAAGAQINPKAIDREAATRALQETGYVHIPETFRDLVQVSREQELAFATTRLFGLIRGGQDLHSAFTRLEEEGTHFTQAEQQAIGSRVYEQTKALVFSQTKNMDQAILTGALRSGFMGIPPKDYDQLYGTRITLPPDVQAQAVIAAEKRGQPVKTQEQIVATPGLTEEAVKAQKESEIEKAGKTTTVTEKAKAEVALDQPLPRETAQALGVPISTTLRQAIQSDLQPLSEQARKDIANFTSVDQAVDQIEKLSKRVNTFGPLERTVMGPTRKSQLFFQTNVDVVLLESKKGLLGNLARGIAQERGVLNEGDINRALSLVPDITDTKEVAQQKIADLKSFVKEQKERHKEARGPISAGQPQPVGKPGATSTAPVSKPQSDAERKFLDKFMPKRK